jgi:hypothetical protein
MEFLNVYKEVACCHSLWKTGHYISSKITHPNKCCNYIATLVRNYDQRCENNVPAPSLFTGGRRH